ncbi:MAG: glycoside hydrolase family 130 protein [Armatimonadota bacterium]|nr:glycoside hydrolase family 130 protein [Armatimonadota bacterium]
MEIDRREFLKRIGMTAAAAAAFGGAAVALHDRRGAECLLNPGVFRYNNRIGLLLRVAERPPQQPGWITTPILDPGAEDGVRLLRVRRDDPDVDASDPRVFIYRGETYLTTLSHLRLAWSHDGVSFSVEEAPALEGMGPLESYGMEDCRVVQLEGRYCLTYTAVSASGFGVGLITTTDWRHFTRHGMIFPPPNKDCALFPRKIKDAYMALHRPSGLGIGGSYIWAARSPDLLHWGDHRCVATTRPGCWDSARVGAGASPIETPAGWLEIYHGADQKNRYCLGALLLDLENPSTVLGRSEAPLMEPTTPYERKGFFGNVVFTNGHLVENETITLYYGAADEVICGATLSLSQVLASLATG